MGRLGKIRDARDEQRKVDEQMLKIDKHARRTGQRVSADEHARLQEAAEAAAKKLRDAIRGRS
jgi:hypothetical protein